MVKILASAQSRISKERTGRQTDVVKNRLRQPGSVFLFRRKAFEPELFKNRIYMEHVPGNHNIHHKVEVAQTAFPTLLITPPG